MDEMNQAIAPPQNATQGTVNDLHQKIGEKEIGEALAIMRKYKDGKTALEQRIVDDELWWKMRHWEAIRNKTADCGKDTGPEPSSAWLFNTLLNKHADVMDNYPEPVVLPREQSDEESAKTLSEVLPVVLENSDFDRTYADTSWEKLKHGTGVYGIFWDTRKENGLGDIEIRGIDLLKIFWEPGITDIQKSENLFIADLVSTKALEQQYPQYRGKLSGSTVDVKQYYYDDTVDISDKSVVVDWYYKVVAPDGRTLLHYAKFVGNTLLYASENDPAYCNRGFYDHGKYPVVFDSLFPEKGTPVGFGYIAVTKNPQLYIDMLSANIMESSMMATKKRFFVSTSTNVNPHQFSDWKQQIVPVEGELSDSRIQEIRVDPLSSVYLDVLAQKVDEMKDTAGNRDVNSGSAGSGVTAAAAIAALQEAGNKTSRDLISASYRAHTEICKLCIELMRQFYDETRSFRITGNTSGANRYVKFSNEKLREQLVGKSADGRDLYRKPVFDLKVKAQKRNPFSRMEQNERAKELYAAGFFNPDRAQEALNALNMMDFEGIDSVKDEIRQGQTLLQMLREAQEQNAKLYQLIQMMRGRDASLPQTEGAGHAAMAGGNSAPPSGVNADSLTRETMKAHTPMTAYGDRLARRSTPSVSGT